jgi:hypothetical protein
MEVSTGHVPRISPGTSPCTRRDVVGPSGDRPVLGSRAYVVSSSTPTAAPAIADASEFLDEAYLDSTSLAHSRAAGTAISVSPRGFCHLASATAAAAAAVGSRSAISMRSQATASSWRVLSANDRHRSARADHSGSPASASDTTQRSSSRFLISSSRRKLARMSSELARICFRCSQPPHRGGGLGSPIAASSRSIPRRASGVASADPRDRARAAVEATAAGEESDAASASDLTALSSIGSAINDHHPHSQTT